MDRQRPPKRMKLLQTNARCERHRRERIATALARLHRALPSYLPGAPPPAKHALLLDAAEQLTLLRQQGAAGGADTGRRLAELERQVAALQRRNGELTGQLARTRITSDRHRSRRRVPPQHTCTAASLPPPGSAAPENRTPAPSPSSVAGNLAAPSPATSGCLSPPSSGVPLRSTATDDAPSPDAVSETVSGTSAVAESACVSGALLVQRLTSSSVQSLTTRSLTSAVVNPLVASSLAPALVQSLASAVVQPLASLYSYPVTLLACPNTPTAMPQLVVVTSRPLPRILPRPALLKDRQSHIISSAQSGDFVQSGSSSETVGLQTVKPRSCATSVPGIATCLDGMEPGSAHAPISVVLEYHTADVAAGDGVSSDACDLLSVGDDDTAEQACQSGGDSSVGVNESCTTSVSEMVLRASSSHTSSTSSDILSAAINAAAVSATDTTPPAVCSIASDYTYKTHSPTKSLFRSASCARLFTGDQTRGVHSTALVGQPSERRVSFFWGRAGVAMHRNRCKPRSVPFYRRAPLNRRVRAAFNRSEINQSLKDKSVVSQSTSDKHTGSQSALKSTLSQLVSSSSVTDQSASGVPTATQSASCASADSRSATANHGANQLAGKNINQSIVKAVVNQPMTMESDADEMGASATGKAETEQLAVVCDRAVTTSDATGQQEQDDDPPSVRSARDSSVDCVLALYPNAVFSAEPDPAVSAVPSASISSVTLPDSASSADVLSVKAPAISTAGHVPSSAELTGSNTYSNIATSRGKILPITSCAGTQSVSTTTALSDGRIGLSSPQTLSVDTTRRGILSVASVQPVSAGIGKSVTSSPSRDVSSRCVIADEATLADPTAVNVSQTNRAVRDSLTTLKLQEAQLSHSVTSVTMTTTAVRGVAAESGKGGIQQTKSAALAEQRDAERRQNVSDKRTDSPPNAQQLTSTERLQKPPQKNSSAQNISIAQLSCSQTSVVSAHQAPDLYPTATAVSTPSRTPAASSAESVCTEYPYHSRATPLTSAMPNLQKSRHINDTSASSSSLPSLAVSSHVRTYSAVETHQSTTCTPSRASTTASSVATSMTSSSMLDSVTPASGYGSFLTSQHQPYAKSSGVSCVADAASARLRADDQAEGRRKSTTRAGADDIGRVQSVSAVDTSGGSVAASCPPSSIYTLAGGPRRSSVFCIDVLCSKESAGQATLASPVQALAKLGVSGAPTAALPSSMQDSVVRMLPPPPSTDRKCVPVSSSTATSQHVPWSVATHCGSGQSTTAAVGFTTQFGGAPRPGTLTSTVASHATVNSASSKNGDVINSDMNSTVFCSANNYLYTSAATNNSSTVLCDLASKSSSASRNSTSRSHYVSTTAATNVTTRNSLTNIGTTNAIVAAANNPITVASIMSSSNAPSSRSNSGTSRSASLVPSMPQPSTTAGVSSASRSVEVAPSAALVAGDRRQVAAVSARRVSCEWGDGTVTGARGPPQPQYSAGVTQHLSAPASWDGSQRPVASPGRVRAPPPPGVRSPHDTASVPTPPRSYTDVTGGAVGCSSAAMVAPLPAADAQQRFPQRLCRRQPAGTVQPDTAVQYQYQLPQQPGLLPAAPHPASELPKPGYNAYSQPRPPPFYHCTAQVPNQTFYSSQAMYEPQYQPEQAYWPTAPQQPMLPPTGAPVNHKFGVRPPQQVAPPPQATQCPLPPFYQRPFEPQPYYKPVAVGHQKETLNGSGQRARRPEERLATQRQPRGVDGKELAASVAVPGLHRPLPPQQQQQLQMQHQQHRLPQQQSQQHQLQLSGGGASSDAVCNTQSLFSVHHLVNTQQKKEPPRKDTTSAAKRKPEKKPASGGGARAAARKSKSSYSAEALLAPAELQRADELPDLYQLGGYSPQYLPPPPPPPPAGAMQSSGWGHRGGLAAPAGIGTSGASASAAPLAASGSQTAYSTDAKPARKDRSPARAPLEPRRLDDLLLSTSLFTECQGALLPAATYTPPADEASLLGLLGTGRSRPEERAVQEVEGRQCELWTPAGGGGPLTSFSLSNLLPEIGNKASGHVYPGSAPAVASSAPCRPALLGGEVRSLTTPDLPAHVLSSGQMALVLLPCDLPSWPAVQRHLTAVKQLNSGEQLITALHALHNTCCVSLDPCEEPQDPRRFDGLHLYLHQLPPAARERLFSRTLPCMVNHALKLKLLKPPDGLHYSLQQQAGSVELDRRFVASLLANCFFSTFPKRSTISHPTLLDANFASFFYYLRSPWQRAKLDAVLLHFDAMAEAEPVGTVTYTRKVMSGRQFGSVSDWLGSAAPLCPLVVRHSGRVEDAEPGVSQVCFLSAQPVTDVTRHSRSQEAVTAVTHPELLALPVFLERLEDNEALSVNGCVRSSRLVPPAVGGDAPTVTRVHNDAGRHICGLDAENYRRLPASQYDDDAVLRELNKTYLAFQQSGVAKRLSPIGESNCASRRASESPERLIETELSNRPVLTETQLSNRPVLAETQLGNLQDQTVPSQQNLVNRSDLSSSAYRPQTSLPEATSVAAVAAAGMGTGEAALRRPATIGGPTAEPPTGDTGSESFTGSPRGGATPQGVLSLISQLQRSIERELGVAGQQAHSQIVSQVMDRLRTLERGRLVRLLSEQCDVTGDRSDDVTGDESLRSVCQALVSGGEGPAWQQQEGCAHVPQQRSVDTEAFFSACSSVDSESRSHAGSCDSSGSCSSAVLYRGSVSPELDRERLPPLPRRRSTFRDRLREADSRAERELRRGETEEEARTSPPRQPVGLSSSESLSNRQVGSPPTCGERHSDASDSRLLETSAYLPKHQETRATERQESSGRVPEQQNSCSILPESQDSCNILPEQQDSCRSLSPSGNSSRLSFSSEFSSEVAELCDRFGQWLEEPGGSLAPRDLAVLRLTQRLLRRTLSDTCTDAALRVHDPAHPPPTANILNAGSPPSSVARARSRGGGHVRSLSLAEPRARQQLVLELAHRLVQPHIQLQPQRCPARRLCQPGSGPVLQSKPGSGPVLQSQPGSGPCKPGSGPVVQILEAADAATLHLSPSCSARPASAAVRRYCESLAARLLLACVRESALHLDFHRAKHRRAYRKVSERVVRERSRPPAAAPTQPTPTPAPSSPPEQGPARLDAATVEGFSWTLAERLLEETLRQLPSPRRRLLQRLISGRAHSLDRKGILKKSRSALVRSRSSAAGTGAPPPQQQPVNSGPPPEAGSLELGQSRSMPGGLNSVQPPSPLLKSSQSPLLTSSQSPLLTSHPQQQRRKSRRESFLESRQATDPSLASCCCGDGARPAATGNWGCGRRQGGDPQLKAAIQWLGASRAELPCLVYYTCGHPALNMLQRVAGTVSTRQWTVGELATAVLEHCRRRLQRAAQPNPQQCSVATDELFDELLNLPAPCH